MFRLLMLCAALASGVADAARALDGGASEVAASKSEPAWIGESRRLAAEIVGRRQLLGKRELEALEARAVAAAARGDLDPVRFLTVYYIQAAQRAKAERWTQIHGEAASRAAAASDLALNEVFQAYAPALAGRYLEASTRLERIVATAKEPLVVALGSQLLAYAATDAGRPTLAIRRASEGLAALRGQQGKDWIAYGLHDAWRYAAKELRDWDTTAKHTRTAYELALKSPYPVDGVSVLYNLSKTASDAGFHAAATELAALEAQLAAQTGLDVEKFFAASLCARVKFNARDYDGALACAETAITEDSAPGEYVPEIRALQVASLARLGRGVEARRALDALLASAAERQDSPLATQIEQYKAEVRFAEGDAAAAFEILRAHHETQERRSAELFNAGAAELRATVEAELAAAERRAAATRHEASVIEKRATLQARLLLLVCLFTIVAGALLVVMRRNARRLADARAAAEAANRSKSEFLASMSHELRTPLNGVLGMAQVLYSEVRDAGQREQVRTILDSGRTLTAILNDILDLSKIEAGKLDITPVDDDLHHALRRLVALFEPQAREKGVALSLDIAPGASGWLRFDPVRVRQCVANLLSNAVKFTEHGTVRLRVSTVALGDSVRVEIVVSDTGVGMDAATLDRLFAPFTQADATITRRYGGTGLGLTITRRLARLMGGDVAARSAVGEGTTMTFTFRTSPAASEAPASRSVDEAEARRGAGAVLRGKTVLIVDDIMVNRQVAALFLGPFGAKVVHAASGAEALAYLDRNSADVVLMDVQMPEMDGFEATRRIRALGGANGVIPIVALTAEAMEGDRARCLAAGMTDYAPKPLDARTLLAAISRAMTTIATAA